MQNPYRHSVLLFLVITTILLQEKAFSFYSNRIQQNFSEVAQETLPTRKDYALFFAVDDYRAVGLPNLKGPISDAEKIATLLENHYGFETMIFRNLNRQEIEDKLEEWQEKAFGEDDQLFILFSGHGKYEEKYKKGYFIPAGKPGAFNSSFNELLDLATLVTKIPCKHILLAIDACYSGTIDKEINPKDSADPREKIKEINKKIKFIRNQWQFKSRLFLTSGGKVRTPDDSEFAKALIKALRSTLTTGDGILAYQDILGRLIRVSPLPHYGEFDGHENGGFLFISKEIKNAEVGKGQENPIYINLGETHSSTISKNSTLELKYRIQEKLDRSRCHIGLLNSKTKFYKHLTDIESLEATKRIFFDDNHHFVGEQNIKIVILYLPELDIQDYRSKIVEFKAGFPLKCEYKILAATDIQIQ